MQSSPFIQRKSFLITVVSICFLFATNVTAQKSVEKIIDRYRKANFPGGDTISYANMIITGKMKMGLMEFETKAYIKEKKLRMEMAFQGEKFIQGVNRGQEWNYNPLTEKVIVKPKREGLANEFDIRFTDLLKVNGNEYKAEYLGKANAEDKKGYLIKVDHAERSNYYVIDDQNYVVLKNYSKNEQPSYFSDYRKIGGIQLPHYFKFQVEDKLMEFFVKDINVDAEINDSVFMPPQEKEVINTVSKQDTYEKAKKLMEYGAYEQAIEQYDNYLKGDRRDYKAYNNRGYCKLQTGKYYGAIADFNKCLELKPAFSAAYSNLGLAKYYLQDLNNAIADFNKAIALDSTNARAYGNLAMVKVEQGSLEASLQDIKNGVSMDSSIPELHYNKGIILHELEQFEEAIDAFQQSKSLGYYSSELFNYLGNCFLGMEKYDSALVQYDSAIINNPNESTYFVNRGLTYVELDRYKKALEDYRIAAALNPEDKEVYNYLGITYFYLEHYKEAIKYYNKSIGIDSLDAVVYDNRALAKERINDFEGAVEDYTKSIKLYPSDPVIFYKRGMAKIYNGQRYEGCVDLSKSEEMGYKKAGKAILNHCD